MFCLLSEFLFIFFHQCAILQKCTQICCTHQGQLQYLCYFCCTIHLFSQLSTSRWKLCYCQDSNENKYWNVLWLLVQIMREFVVYAVWATGVLTGWLRTGPGLRENKHYFSVVYLTFDFEGRDLVPLLHQTLRRHTAVNYLKVESMHNPADKKILGAFSSSLVCMCVWERDTERKTMWVLCRPLKPFHTSAVP